MSVMAESYRTLTAACWKLTDHGIAGVCSLSKPSVSDFCMFRIHWQTALTAFAI